MKIFKAIIATVMVMAIMFSTVTVAMAETKYYKQPAEAVVISTNVSVRERMNENADRIARLSNGDKVNIVGESGRWYIIDMSTFNQPELIGVYGYALKQYFLKNPKWITLTADETYLWADPWGTGISNGSKSKGTKMLVLMETAEWYVVQTRDNSAGSSFIKKSDVYQNGNTSTGTNVIVPSVQQNGAGTYMVKCDTLGVYPYPDDNVERVDFIHYGDIVNVLSVGDYFTKIKHEINGISCECYVHSVHLIKVAE